MVGLQPDTVMNTIAETHHLSHNAQKPLFTRASMLFALYAVVIPNIIYLVATPFYLAERAVSPGLFLVAGIAALLVPSWLAITLFLITMMIDLAFMAMVAFNMPFEVALDSVRYLATIDLRSSAFYALLGTAATTTTLTSAILIIRNRNMLRRASLFPAILLVALLMMINLVWTRPYYALPERPFESAMTQTGMTADGLTANRRNLLVVMVEGLGAFKDGDERNLLKNTLVRGLPAGRYAVEDGTTYYNGSTTGAASRELCGRWGSYLDYLGNGSFDCLPRRLAKHGYETIAYHAFDSFLFERSDWYPRIGFTELNFKADLKERFADSLDRQCGSVFPGLCDSQVGKLVHQRLIEETSKPKFVYWLTLNSHIPFVKSPDDPLQCRSKPLIFDETVCELSNLWHQVFEQVNTIASYPELPPTDILVVGDHHTPLWKRAAKNHFVPERVDWYLLRSLEESGDSKSR